MNNVAKPVGRPPIGDAAMTPAARKRKERAAGKSISITLDLQSAAALLRLRLERNLSTKAAVCLALQRLAEST